MIEAFGTFTPDLDDGGRDEQRDLAGLEARHHRIFLGSLHAAVDQPDAVAEHRLQNLVAFLRRGEIAHLRFLDQRADPVGLRALGYLPAQPVDHVFHAL